MRKLKCIIILVSLVLFSTMCICALRHELATSKYDSSLTIDYSIKQDEITHGATGFLYGIAEPEVPSGNMLYPLTPKVLSTRVPNGLQHPAGDLAQVSNTFFKNGGENIIIYMQDIYDDWYYSYRPDYLETTSKVLDTIIILENSDKFIYQPFNEMNNGEWYGDFSQFNNRILFYNAFKDAYNLIKEKTNGAPVAGPAYTHYDPYLIKEFLEYCISNDCVPDVMVWHELFWYSTYGIRDTVKDYRQIEKELGLGEIRIILDEYGSFKDLGTPGNLLQYIASFEETNVEGCLAFWRLPNNLNDLCSSNNMPTPAWWLYQWYAEMQGITYKVEKSEDTIPYFSAITTSDNEKINILCGGSTGKTNINLNNINQVNGFENAKSIYYKVEYVDFEGLSAECLGGTPLLDGTSQIRNNCLRLNLGNTTTSRAYKITIYPSLSDKKNINHYDTPTRYESERERYDKATLIRSEDIRYATSGDAVKVNRGGSITFDISINNDGVHRLDLCYISAPKIGKAKLNARIKVIIDGLEETHILPNSLTNHSSNSYSLNSYLKKGKHNITIKYDYGQFILDFIDVEYLASGYENLDNTYKIIPLLHKSDTEYMVVVPQSSIYSFNEKVKVNAINGVTINATNNYFFLEKGVNILKMENKVNDLSATRFIIKNTNYSILDAENSTSYLVKNEYSPSGYYLKDAPSNHMVTFNVNVSNEGYYALTTFYSNEQSFGTHAYNVKLIERYANVIVNDVLIGRHYFRNTYSNYVFNEKTLYVYLLEGNNKISFVNDGGYIWNNVETYLPNISNVKVYPMSWSLFVKHPS